MPQACSPQSAFYTCMHVPCTFNLHLFSLTKIMFYGIHVGWNVDFDLPDLGDSTNTDNSELTTITSSLPTTVTCTVTNSQTMTSVCPPTSSRASKVCKAYQADSYIC